MRDRIQRKPTTAMSLAVLAFAQFREGLHHYLLKRLKNAETAEDLAQEVYLRLLRATGRERVRHPQAYVYRVASNVVYEFQQHERRGLVMFDSEGAAQAGDRLADEAAAPEELMEQQKRESQLAAVVARLPPMQRAVFLLAKHQDLTHAQIAKKLGISVNTARVHLYRALCQCRQQISNE